MVIHSLCWFWVGLCLTLLFSASVEAQLPPLKYASEVLHGQVVDKEGRPLAWAIVVALWRCVPAQSGSLQTSTRLHLSEAATDRSGQFVIPAWGPKECPSDMHLDPASPRVGAYRLPYLPVWRAHSGRQNAKELGASWSGQIIQLGEEPRVKSQEEMIALIHAFYDAVRQGGAHDPKDWRHYPRTAMAMYELRLLWKFFPDQVPAEAGEFPGLPNMEALEAADQEFLKNYERTVNR